MKSLFLFILLSSCLHNDILGQNIAIYRRADYNNGSMGQLYEVDILYLSKDSTYRLSFQEYGSKKASINNLLVSQTIERGIWTESGDSLILTNILSGSQRKFIKKRRKIFYANQEDRILNIPMKNKYAWKIVN